MFAQFLAELRARFEAYAQNDKDVDRIALDVVRQGNCGGLGHGRVRDQRRFDLGRAEPVAGNLDDVVGPADDPEIAAKGDIPLLTRWRFNLTDNSVKEEALDTIPSEFPCINANYLGRKNRYGYTAKSAPGALPLFDGVIKYDFETGQSWHYNYGENCYGGEVVFAANPQGKTEDDGWLITFVYDQAQDTSELIILDAQNPESKAIARIEIPQRVPYGFHGLWIG
jgi:carotenoid cleavage dioxygenase